MRNSVFILFAVVVSVFLTFLATDILLPRKIEPLLSKACGIDPGTNYEVRHRNHVIGLVGYRENGLVEIEEHEIAKVIRRIELSSDFEVYSSRAWGMYGSRSASSSCKYDLGFGHLEYEVFF